MSYNDGKFYGFTNDEIFGSIMQNKRFCKAIIKAVLPDVNVVSVESIDTQKELGTKSDKRSKSVLRSRIKRVTYMILKCRLITIMTLGHACGIINPRWIGIL